MPEGSRRENRKDGSVTELGLILLALKMQEQGLETRNLVALAARKAGQQIFS